MGYSHHILETGHTCGNIENTMEAIKKSRKVRFLDSLEKYHVLLASKQQTHMKMAVFWVVALCSLVEVYQRFRGPCCLHHQGDETHMNVFNTDLGNPIFEVIHKTLTKQPQIAAKTTPPPLHLLSFRETYTPLKASFNTNTH
jgi:hypothetical protein